MIITDYEEYLFPEMESISFYIYSFLDTCKRNWKFLEKEDTFCQKYTLFY